MYNFYTFKRVVQTCSLCLVLVFLASKSFAQDLSVTVTSNQGTFSIYNYITFYVDARNNGTSAVSNVRVSVPMPAGAAFDCGVANQGVWESWTTNGYWQIGTLNAGQTVRLTTTLFTLNVPNIILNGTISSTTSGFSDPVSTNNTSSRTVTRGATAPRLPCDGVVTQGDSVDIELTNTITTPNGEVNVGQVASILLQVRNRSTRDASNLSVRNVLPAGLTYQNHFGDGTFTSSTGNWNIGVLQGNATRTLTLNVLVGQGGQLRDVAQVFSCDQPDIDSRPNNYSAANPILEDDEAALTINGMQVDMELDMELDDDTPTNINVGQNITYVLTLRNVGLTRGDNVKVRAILPVGLQYVSSTASLGVYDAPTGVWVLSATPDAQGNKPGFTMNPNQTVTLELTARPTQTGTHVFNTEMRVCNMPDIDSSPSNMIATEDDDATVSINVQQNTDPTAADLQLGMTDIRIPTAAGDSVVWTLGVTNAGPAAATNIVIRDTFPSVFSITNTLASAGTWNATNKTWTIASLPNGGFQSITFRGTTSCFTNSLKNFAQVVSATQSDPDSPHGNDTDQTANEDDEFVLNYNALACVANAADLALSSTMLKTPVLNGDSLVFRLTVTNTGPQNATGVSVRATLPTALASLVATTSVGTWATNTWTVGNLSNGGSATITFRGVVTLAAANAVFAQVMAGSPTDPDSPHGNDTNQTADEDDETLLTIAPTSAPRADLELGIAASRTAVSVGNTVALTVTLTNRGPSTATGISVVNTLPTGLRRDTVLPPSIGTFSAGTWTIPSLASGSSATLTINTTVTAISTTLRAFAQVTASGLNDPDSSPNNNTTTTPAEDDEAVAVLSNAANAQCDLEVALTCPYTTALPIYQNVNFVCTVRNTGGAAATGVRVALSVPTGMAFSSSTTQNGVYDSWAGVWDIGNLAAGGTATLTINLFTLQTTTAMFAQVIGASPVDLDSSPNNNATTNPAEDDEAALRVPNVAPQRRVDMELTHTANVTLVQTNTAVGFGIAIVNRGDTAASGVTVRYPIPTGMSFVSATPQQGNYNATTGIWTVGSVAPNQTLILTVNATVTATTGGISSFAQIQAATPNNDPDSAPNNNTTNTPTEDDEGLVEIPRQGTGSGCDLELTMTASSPTYRIYTNTDFTVTVRNTGAVSATGVVVSFPFPANFVFTSQTLSVGTTYDNFRYEWNIGTIAAGGSKTMTLTLFSLQAAAPARAFAQVKTASPTDSDSSPNNNTTTTPAEDDEALVVVTPAGSGNLETRPTSLQQLKLEVVKVYPNPVTNEFVGVEINSLMDDEMVQFSWIDPTGRVVKIEQQRVSKGNNRIGLEMNELPDGVYFLHIQQHFQRNAPVKVVKLTQ